MANARNTRNVEFLFQPQENGFVCSPFTHAHMTHAQLSQCHWLQTGSFYLQWHFPAFPPLWHYCIWKKELPKTRGDLRGHLVDQFPHKLRDLGQTSVRFAVRSESCWDEPRPAKVADLFSQRKPQPLGDK